MKVLLMNIYFYAQFIALLRKQRLNMFFMNSLIWRPTQQLEMDTGVFFTFLSGMYSFFEIFPIFIYNEQTGKKIMEYQIYRKYFEN